MMGAHQWTSAQALPTVGAGITGSTKSQQHWTMTQRLPKLYQQKHRHTNKDKLKTHKQYRVALLHGRI